MRNRTNWDTHGGRKVRYHGPWFQATVLPLNGVDHEKLIYKHLRRRFQYWTGYSPVMLYQRTLIALENATRLSKLRNFMKSKLVALQEKFYLEHIMLLFFPVFVWVIYHYSPFGCRRLGGCIPIMLHLSHCHWCCLHFLLGIFPL